MPEEKTSRSLHQAYVAVGSNIDPRGNIPRVIELLTGNEGVSLLGLSTFYRTPALPGPEDPAGARAQDPDYLNGVLELGTVLDPATLAITLERSETALGRRRTGDRYAPRTMDLDLLLFLPASVSGAQLPCPPSDVPPPHREIRTRAFVAIPLLELAPNLILPPDGIPLSAVANSFPGPGGEAETTFTQDLRDRFLAP